MRIECLSKFARLRLQDIVGLVTETVTEWSVDKAPRLGASLAFYTLLSLSPVLVVVVAVAALAFGKEAAQGQLAWEIQGLMGRDGARSIQDVLQTAYKPSSGWTATAFGLGVLAFGASSVVVELRDALNTIWHVPTEPGSTGFAMIFRIVKERFYSFAMILGIGFLLLVSLVLSAAIAALGEYFGSVLPTHEAVLHAATFVVSFLVITFLFAAIYKIMPDVRLKWSDVAVGACVTALIFTIGKQLIALYIGKFGVGSAYGAAGSLVVVLVWVYYSAQLFFFGAEFTKVYTKRFGSHFSETLLPAPPQPAAVIVDSSANPSNPRLETVTVKHSGP
jgi:membrane protein